MNCIIVDDETLALKLLEDNIRMIPFLKLVAVCNSAAEAITMLQNNQVDLLITDIQMPGINGMQLVKSLKNPPMVIIHTAYQHHAVESYDLDVVDYILKPVEFERFLKAINKAMNHKNVKKVPSLSEQTIEKKEYSFFNADYGNVKVTFKEVVYIEGVGDYVKIYFAGNKQPLLIRLLLKNIDELLPYSYFLRIHKSYIVNKEFITHTRTGLVCLNTIELPVGNTYKPELERFLQNS